MEIKLPDNVCINFYEVLVLYLLFCYFIKGNCRHKVAREVYVNKTLQNLYIFKYVIFITKKPIIIFNRLYFIFI